MTLLPWIALGLASAAPLDDLRREVEAGVVVNWSTLTVEATTGRLGSGVAAVRKAAEHDARLDLDPLLRRGASQVTVVRGLEVADLLEDSEHGGALEGRLGKWAVAEARYHASGRVELVGELPLQEVLKPWTLSVARLPPLEPAEPAFTGLLVDARGTGAEPAYAPRLLHEGSVLFEATLWDEVAVFEVPVVYVPDPAHPAAARAGEKPLILRARSHRGPDLVLDTEDAIRFRTGLRDARVLGEGTFVVVLDP